MKIKHLDECSTTAGAVATVAQPFKAVQERSPAKDKPKGSNLLKGIKTSAKYANSLHESEGFPHDVDHMPGKNIKHQDTNCTACHGRKVQYKLDGKLFADNKQGATKVKCPTCKGTGDKQGVAEGAKVDRMVKHIAKSERGLGHSKKEAENIAWATANKRGYLDNKNKKKVREGVIAQADEWRVEQDEDGIHVHLIDGEGTIRATLTLQDWQELSGKQGVAEGLSDTQKKIEDTILKLEQRLKFAKTPEQWDNIKNRIERLQAGLNRSKQGVAEDAAGVGVVKNSKDPRYVMATMGDQNDVTAQTLPKEMQAYGLIGRKPPKFSKK